MKSLSLLSFSVNQWAAHAVVLLGQGDGPGALILRAFAHEEHVAVVRENVHVPADAHAFAVEILLEDGRDGLVRGHGVGEAFVVDGAPDGAALHESRKAQNEERLKIAFHN